ERDRGSSRGDPRRDRARRAGRRGADRGQGARGLSDTSGRSRRHGDAPPRRPGRGAGRAARTVRRARVRGAQAAGVGGAVQRWRRRMTVWSVDWLVSASGGRLVRKPRGVDPDAPSVAGVSIDSRSIEPGEAFVALRGERHDGHAYLGEAVARGAACIFVERDAAADGLPDHVPVIRVHDCRDALTRLAQAHRALLRGTRVVAVTGSNGKTSTVRFIDAALRVALRGSASAKSFNNDLGVPLTILRARPGDDYLVCEVGMNAPGEIEPLARLIEPDIAVITNVGRAHLEHFGSVDAVAREKATLLRHLGPGGWALVNAACETRLGEIVATVPNRRRVGDCPTAELRVGGVAHAQRGAQTTLEFDAHDADGSRRFSVPAPGAHNAVNAGFAIAIARLLGV